MEHLKALPTTGGSEHSQYFILFRKFLSVTTCCLHLTENRILVWEELTGGGRQSSRIKSKLYELFFRDTKKENLQLCLSVGVDIFIRHCQCPQSGCLE